MDKTIPELVELPPPVFEFMREELTSPNLLARAISDLPLERGHVQVFATANTPEEHLLELRENPFLSDNDARECWFAYKNFVANYLQRGDSYMFLMSNPFSTRDHFLQRLRNFPKRLGREWTDWLICADYIGFYVTEAAGKRCLRDFFDDVQAITTFGILTHGVDMLLHNELPQETLERAMAQADYVVIGAYEDRSALLWRR